MPPKSNKAPSAATKVKPPLDLQRAQELNAQVLKRKDPEIDEILGTFGHVVLYDFNKQTKGWVSKNIEGSLFVVKRRAIPRFQMFLLNKKGTDDFTQDIADGFTFQIEKPYMFYKSATTGEVIGVWFYDVAEADKIQVLLNKIIATFPSSRQRETPKEASSSESSDTGFFGWKANVATTEAHAHQPLPVPPPAANGSSAVDVMLQPNNPAAAPQPHPPVAHNTQSRVNTVNPLDLLMGSSSNKTTTTTTTPVPAAAPTPPTGGGGSGAAGGNAGGNDASSALLQQLLKGSSGALPALPAPVVGPEPVSAELVQQLLVRLSRNAQFVAALTEEVNALGLVKGAGNP